jgi:hypothetical protein
MRTAFAIANRHGGVPAHKKAPALARHAQWTRPFPRNGEVLWTVGQRSCDSLVLEP